MPRKRKTRNPISFVVNSWVSEYDDAGTGGDARGGGRRRLIVQTLTPGFDYVIDPVDPLRVCFTSTASDTSGSTITHMYRLGDNRTNRNADFCHEYDSFGTYTVTQTVYNEEGEMSEIQKTFTLSEPDELGPPVLGSPGITWTANCTNIDWTVDPTGVTDSRGVAWADLPEHSLAVMVTVTDPNGDGNDFQQYMTTDPEHLYQFRTQGNEDGVFQIEVRDQRPTPDQVTTFSQTIPIPRPQPTFQAQYLTHDVAFTYSVSETLPPRTTLVDASVLPQGVEPVEWEWTIAPTDAAEAEFVGNTNAEAAIIRKPGGGTAAFGDTVTVRLRVKGNDGTWYGPRIGEVLLTNQANGPPNPAIRTNRIRVTDTSTPPVPTTTEYKIRHQNAIDPGDFVDITDHIIPPSVQLTYTAVEAGHAFTFLEPDPDPMREDDEVVVHAHAKNSDNVCADEYVIVEKPTPPGGGGGAFTVAGEYLWTNTEPGNEAVDFSVADFDPALNYTWRFPDGTTATGPTVNGHPVPDTPYTALVTATEPSTGESRQDEVTVMPPVPFTGPPVPGQQATADPVTNDSNEVGAVDVTYEPTVPPELAQNIGEIRITLHDENGSPLAGPQRNLTLDIGSVEHQALLDGTYSHTYEDIPLAYAGQPLQAIVEMDYTVPDGYQGAGTTQTVTEINNVTVPDQRQFEVRWIENTDAPGTYGTYDEALDAVRVKYMIFPGPTETPATIPPSDYAPAWTQAHETWGHGHWSVSKAMREAVTQQQYATPTVTYHTNGIHNGRTAHNVQIGFQSPSSLTYLQEHEVVVPREIFSEDHYYKPPVPANYDPENPKFASDGNLPGNWHGGTHGHGVQYPANLVQDMQDDLNTEGHYLHLKNQQHHFGTGGHDPLFADAWSLDMSVPRTLPLQIVMKNADGDFDTDTRDVVFPAQAQPVTPPTPGLQANNVNDIDNDNPTTAVSANFEPTVPPELDGYIGPITLDLLDDQGDVVPGYTVTYPAGSPEHTDILNGTGNYPLPDTIPADSPLVGPQLQVQATWDYTVPPGFQDEGTTQSVTETAPFTVADNRVFDPAIDVTATAVGGFLHITPEITLPDGNTPTEIEILVPDSANETTHTITLNDPAHPDFQDALAGTYTNSDIAATPEANYPVNVKLTYDQPSLGNTGLTTTGFQELSLPANPSISTETTAAPGILTVEPQVAVWTGNTPTRIELEVWDEVAGSLLQTIVLDDPGHQDFQDALAGTYSVDVPVNQPGEHSVQSTLTYDQPEIGSGLTVTGYEEINAVDGQQPPLAVIDGLQAFLHADGRMLRFDGTSSSDPDGTIAEYRWRWDPSATDTPFSATANDPAWDLADPVLGNTANPVLDVIGPKWGSPDPLTTTVQLTVVDNDGNVSAPVTQQITLHMEGDRSPDTVYQLPPSDGIAGTAKQYEMAQFVGAASTIIVPTATAGTDDSLLKLMQLTRNIENGTDLILDSAYITTYKTDLQTAYTGSVKDKYFQEPYSWPHIEVPFYYEAAMPDEFLTVSVFYHSKPEADPNNKWRTSADGTSPPEYKTVTVTEDRNLTYQEHLEDIGYVWHAWSRSPGAGNFTKLSSNLQGTHDVTTDQATTPGRHINNIDVAANRADLVEGWNRLAITLFMQEGFDEKVRLTGYQIPWPTQDAEWVRINPHPIANNVSITPYEGIARIGGPTNIQTFNTEVAGRRVRSWDNEGDVDHTALYGPEPAHHHIVRIASISPKIIHPAQPQLTIFFRGDSTAQWESQNPDGAGLDPFITGAASQLPFWPTTLKQMFARFDAANLSTKYTYYDTAARIAWGNQGSAIASTGPQFALVDLSHFGNSAAQLETQLGDVEAIKTLYTTETGGNGYTVDHTSYDAAIANRPFLERARYGSLFTPTPP